MQPESSSGSDAALPGLERRASVYRRILEEVCSWAKRVSEEMAPATIIVFGSYARGDFNVWSDVDVIVISGRFRGLPFTRRWAILPRTELPLEAIAWTPEEASERLSKPAWRKALRDCLVIVDDNRLAPRTCKRICATETGHRQAQP